MNYAIIILGFALLTAIAVIHARKFNQNIPISSTFHLVWLLVWCGFVAAAFWFRHSWWLVAALVLQRMWFFNTVLNLIRHKPFFYLHGKNETPNGSFFDWLQEKIFGWHYWIVWCLYFLGFVFTIFKV